MRAKISQFLRETATAFRRQRDPEIEELRQDIEALDQYLKIQNLRRAEEKRFLRLRETDRKRATLLMLGLVLLSPQFAHASDLEGTLRNLVTAVTGRLLPIMAMGYLAKNIYGHITGDPNAKLESVRVVVGIACLLGLSGVWNFIASQAR